MHECTAGPCNHAHHGLSSPAPVAVRLCGSTAACCTCLCIHVNPPFAVDNLPADLCSAHLCPLVWPLMADVASDCRERGRSGSSSGGLGGAGGGGQSELQLQRQRVIARRKALQRKLSEVNSIPVLADIALLLMLISHRHNHEPMKAS